MAEVPQTTEDWNARRQLITELYAEQDLPLKEVIEIMETRYHFKATKRMYNMRLKQWKICKNYKAKDKDVLAAQIAAAHAQNRSLDGVTFNNRPVKLDRVLRHCRTVARAQKRKAVIESGSNHRSDSDEAEVPDEVESTFSASISRSSGSSALQNHSSLAAPSILLPADSNTTKSSISYHVQTLFNQTLPSALITTPKNEINLALILEQTKAYYEPQITSLKAGKLDGSFTSEAETRSLVSASPSMFWTNIKSAIYFLKKTPSLAWPLLNEACKDYSLIVTHSPFSFLRELFSTLSPINVKYHPDLRLVLLRFLRHMASVKLSPRHPIALITQELQLDDGDRKTSETALTFMLDLCAREIGHVHDYTISLQRALTNLLRRDYELNTAERLATRLIKTCERDLGPYHPHTCAALEDLVHILSDKADYDRAFKLAESVMERYRVAQGDKFPDSRAAYGMEIMAELCHFKADLESEIQWLQKGVQAAYRARGGVASTMYVRDKFEALLIAKGRSQEALELRTRFPVEDIRNA